MKKRWPRATAAAFGGVAAGLVAGLFGVGGGFLFVAALVFWLGRGQHAAHATALVAVAVTAAAAAGRFALGGAVEWLGAVALVIGAVAGATVGARLLPRLEEVILVRVLAGTLLVLSLRFILAGSADSPMVQDAAPVLGATDLGLHVIGGAVAGLLSSMTGAGGGIVYVPFLALALGYGQHIAEGTSLVAVLPTAVVGAVQHHRNGYTQWAVGLRLGIGGVLGAIIGAQVALSLAPETLARLYGAFLITMAILFLGRARRRAVQSSHSGGSGSVRDRCN